MLDAIRKETFGVDIGQNSWITVSEYDQFITWLRITPNQHLLEVACGSGGPAIYLATKTACHVTGIDANSSAIETARKLAQVADSHDKITFTLADANARLPFDDNRFDGLLCVDAMNHFPDRLAVLKELNRILRPGQRAVFTDPVVITGPVTNDELACRSSIGVFLFVPSGFNEDVIAEAAFKLIERQDVTDNAALLSGRWYEARRKHKEDLVRIEGQERFEDLQRFFETANKLSSERRLSRIVYVVQKQDSDHG